MFSVFLGERIRKKGMHVGRMPHMHAFFAEFLTHYTFTTPFLISQSTDSNTACSEL